MLILNCLSKLLLNNIGLADIFLQAVNYLLCDYKMSELAQCHVLSAK